MDAKQWEDAVIMAKRVPQWGGGIEERRLKQMWVVWLTHGEPPDGLRSAVMGLRHVLSRSKTYHFDLHCFAMARACREEGKQYLVSPTRTQPLQRDGKTAAVGMSACEWQRVPGGFPPRIASASEIALQRAWCGVEEEDGVLPEGGGSGGNGRSCDASLVNKVGRSTCHNSYEMVAPVGKGLGPPHV